MAGGQDRRPLTPSVSTSETFRTKVGADRIVAPPLAPAGSPRRTPIPSGGKRKYSTRELVQAWKAEFPGEFDRFDNTDLVNAILEEQPELEDILDETSFGTESVPPPNLGGYERGPMTVAPKGPIAPPPDRLRLPTYTDMAIEAGLVAVPSYVGGSIGAGAGPAAPAAIPLGAIAGGVAGEVLREGYQNWSGTRDDGISLPNVAVQGLINAVPVAKYAGKVAGALAPGMVDAVAPSIARVAGAALEGAVNSAGSTAAEDLIRDNRAPGLGELATSAGFGTLFGTALGAGGEAVHAYKAKQALPDPALVDMHFKDLADSANRLKAAQDIYDLATVVGQDNPAAGAAMLQRLVTEANALAQADLQNYAGGFVKVFAAHADTLTMDGQISEIEDFLAGLKQRGAVDSTIQQVQGILQDIRTTSQPRPIDQPSERGWYTPYDPGAIHGPEVDPGQTTRTWRDGFEYRGNERALGDAFEQQMGVDPAVRGGAPALVAPDAGAFSVARNPPRPPEQQDLGVPPGMLAEGQPIAEVPGFGATGADALPAVQAGTVSRENGLMLQWLQEDLTQHGFQQGSAQRVTDTEFRPDDPLLENGNVIFTPHSAGTPVLKMFDALGVNMTRSQIAGQIDNYLQGRARRPGKAALAANKIATAMTEAWDPVAHKFDWSLVTDERLKDIGFRSRRDFQSPVQNLHEMIGGQRQPNDLMEKFGVGRVSEGPPPRMGYEDWAPDEIHEARRLVRGASDEDLTRLYSELTTYKADMIDMENPEDFSGPWYDVGPGMIGAELERRGLGKYVQQPLMTEGPGTPGSLPLRDRFAEAHDRVIDRITYKNETVAEAAEAVYSDYGGPEFRTELIKYVNGERSHFQGPELEEDAPVRTTEEQPALLPEVREAEVKSPLLVEEADLFRLTNEIAKPGKAPKMPSLFDETGAVGDVAGKRNKRNMAVRQLAIDDEDFGDLKRKVEALGNQEVAGLLLGDAEGNIRRVVVSENTAANPAKTFEIDADVVRRAQLLARANGWDVLSSFHSQPTGSAEPSKRDLKGTVSDLPMMILGVKGGSLRDVRVWQPSGKSDTPWLEGVVRLGTEKAKAGTPVPPHVASWMVDRIPKFTGAPGDAPAMTDYLKTHKGEFSTEPWYVRAQQFMDEGNPRMAWIEVQSAAVMTQKGVRSTVQASPLKDEHRAALVQRIEQATAAGPQDPVGALFALYDGRTTWVDGVGRIVVAPEIPPSLRGKGVTAGPGGILRPGATTIPLPDQYAVMHMTVDALNDVLKDVKGHEILDDPTGDSYMRLNRQIAEKLMLRSPSSWGASKAMRTAMKRQGMSDRQVNMEIAGQLTRAATESGRFLAALRVWKMRNKADIRAIEGITGASGDIEDVMIIGAGGRKIGRLGEVLPSDTYHDVVQPGRAWDRAMYLNDLTKSERGVFNQFESASRAFMLSQWATAARNFWSINARWGVEMFDEVGMAVANTAFANPTRAIRHLQRAGDLLRYTPVLRPDGWVMPWHARQAQWEHIFDANTALARLPAGKERRAALKLLEGVSEEAAHFLGAVNFGEPTPHNQSKYRILNTISSPTVQNTLTMFNRAQEFTARSGMYVANLRDGMRARGLDPDLVWQLPPADLAAKLGGPEEMRRLLQHAVSGALDFTFSGALIKKGFGKDEFGKPQGSLNAWFIDRINEVAVVRAGYPWPKFNLSAAPRFIWDHSGVNAFVETANQLLLESRNLTGEHLFSGIQGVQRGRLYLGKKAAAFEQHAIPELQGKYRDAQADLGDSLQQVQALDREFSVRKRMVARLERKGLFEAAAAERPHLETLETALQRQMQNYERAGDSMKNLQSQITNRQAIVDQAKAVRAPESYAELWGRAGAGVATMLVPALLLRAEQRGKGTKWYQLRYNIPGIGDTTIDTRPLAPFTQFLFFADVLNDLYAETDWAGAHEDHEAGASWPSAMYGRYEGKYTNKTIGQQALNAFLSMSQAAGTTLAVLEQFTSIGDKGVPSVEEVGNTFMTALGSLMARYTIPFAQFKGLTDFVSPDESNARITSTDMGETLAEKATIPLMQPFANLPFIGAKLIPETYNQLTGQPLDAHMPWLRASLGVTLTQWNKVAGEINDTGTPGDSVYIRATHNRYLDRLIGVAYAKAISQYADPLIFASNYYNGRDEDGNYDEKRKLSPALKRDYLQTVVFPTLKKIAIGEAMASVGWDHMEEARESAEGRRRRLRTQRLTDLMKEENLTDDGGTADPESEPDDAIDLTDEPEPAGVPAGVPAGSPAPTLEGPPPGGQARYQAPGFADEDGPAGRPAGALDRVLAPAFDG